MEKEAIEFVKKATNVYDLEYLGVKMPLEEVIKKVENATDEERYFTCWRCGKKMNKIFDNVYESACSCENREFVKIKIGGDNPVVLWLLKRKNIPNK